MGSTLEELEKQHLLLKQEANELLAKIQRIENKEKIPKLEAAYKGKFFKHSNCDYNERRYFSYFFCKEITPNGNALVDTFETNYEGECSFRSYIEDWPDFDYCTESTEDEYMKALRTFTDRLLNFGDAVVLNQK